MAVSLKQHMREGLIAVINAFNSAMDLLFADAEINTRWYGAGYITANSSQLRFTVPLNEFLVKGQNILTINTFVIGIRPHAGTVTTTVRYPADFTIGECQATTVGIRCILDLNNPLTNLPNNSVVGIDAQINASWTRPI